MLQGTIYHSLKSIFLEKDHRLLSGAFNRERVWRLAKGEKSQSSEARTLESYVTYTEYTAECAYRRAQECYRSIGPLSALFYIMAHIDQGQSVREAREEGARNSECLAMLKASRTKWKSKSKKDNDGLAGWCELSANGARVRCASVRIPDSEASIRPTRYVYDSPTGEPFSNSLSLSLLRACP